MKPLKLLFLSLPLWFLLVMTGHCDAGIFKNLDGSTHSWQFDGREFVPGAGNGAVVVLVREGFQPVLRTGDNQVPSTVVPEGMGVVAGICYVRAAGGKLAYRNDALPEGGRVTVMSASGVVRPVSVDGHGFFSVPLSPGSYEIRGGAAALTITVTAGKTTLVALRTGKRMVD